jgi:hypothetical protein
VWAKVYATANVDAIAQPPAFQREDVQWTLTVRKESNSFRIIVRERLTDGSWPVIPEDPGAPILHLYALMAEIKIRLLADQMPPSLADCVERLYQGRARVTEMARPKNGP